MKIAVVTYYFEPQLGYQEPALANELAKMGHDVYVITSDKRYPAAGIYRSLSNSIGERTVKSGVFLEGRTTVIRLKSRLEIWSRTWLKDLEKTIMELEPDVITVNGMTRFSSFRVPLLKWRKNLGTKLIYDEHMVYSVVRKSLLGKTFYLLFKLMGRPLLLSQSDAFVAITEETKVFMEKTCGIPAARITYIPLGVDHHLFKSDPLARKEVRGQYGILEDDVVFIYAGKVIPDKGPHLLVQSGLRLFGKHKNLRLLFLGNGPEAYIASMKKKVQDSGFGGRVTWASAVSNQELYKYYSAADVGVWPSQESITILEAASCSLPIIVWDSLSLRDRISNGNGFGCRQGDTEDLAKYVERLLVDETLRRSMGQRSRELIETRMNWEVIARQYDQLFTESPCAGAPSLCVAGKLSDES